MLNGIGAFISGVVGNAQAFLVLPVMGLGILVGGFQYMTGNSMAGKSWIQASLIGGAIALLAITIANAAGALMRVAPAAPAGLIVLLPF